MRRIWILLAAVLLSLLAAGCAGAEEGGFAAEILPGGHAVVKGYTGESGDVVIPETVDGHTVTRVTSEIFNGKKELITSITFPDTVTCIGDNVINNMPNLKKVVLPAGLQVLGQNNFNMCPGVEEAVLPPGVFYIGWGCFSSDCDFRLTFTGPVPVLREDFSLWRTESGGILVPDDLAEEYAKVIYSGQPMEKNGQNAVIPEYATPESSFIFDAATGTITGYTGDDVRVDIPSEIGGVPVKAIGEKAFYGSKMIGLFFGEGTESVGEEAFACCYDLTVLSLPDSLVQIGNKAFTHTLSRFIRWGSGLETIGEEAFAVTDVGFDGHNIILPASLREVGREAFCSTHLTGAVFGPAIEKIGGRAFAKSAIDYFMFDRFDLPEIALDVIEENRSTLTDVDINMNASRQDEEAAREFFSRISPEVRAWRANPEDVEYPQRPYNHELLPDNTYAWTEYGGDQAALTPYWTISEEDRKVPVTAVGADLFRGSQTLKIFRVNRSGTFTTIGDNAFRDSTLETVDLFDTVTTLGAGALQDCKFLKELTLPESLAFIGENALSGLSSLETLTVLCDPDLLGENALEGAVRLKNVIVRPDATDEQIADLTRKCGLPWYCSALRAGETSSFLTMPDEPSPEEDFTVNPENGMLDLYLGNAEEIVIPRSVGGVEVRGISAQFADRIRDYTDTGIVNNRTEWVHVKRIVIPETVTFIADSAFEYCQQLESVVCYAPLETTGRAVFQFDRSLKSVLFMNPIRGIDNYCFNGCSALETAWYSGTLDFIGVQAFGGCGLKTFIADAKEIRETAFRDCASLAEAHVRRSIEKMSLSAFSGCTALKTICIETTNDEVFTGDNGYSGDLGGDTVLVIPPETDEKQARYLLRKWHTSNFGPIADENHVTAAPCSVPENPPRPER